MHRVMHRKSQLGALSGWETASRVRYGGSALRGRLRIAYGGSAFSAISAVQISLCELRGITLWCLRRDFIADSPYRFFNVFPITESTEAKISFTGGAKA